MLFYRGNKGMVGTESILGALVELLVADLHRNGFLFKTSHLNQFPLIEVRLLNEAFAVRLSIPGKNFENPDMPIDLAESFEIPVDLGLDLGAFWDKTWPRRMH